MATTVITAVCARMLLTLRGVRKTGERKLSTMIRVIRISAGPMPSSVNPMSRPE